MSLTIFIFHKTVNSAIKSLMFQYEHLSANSPKTEAAQITLIFLHSFCISTNVSFVLLAFQNKFSKNIREKLLLKVCNFGATSGTSGNCKNNVFFFTGVPNTPPVLQ